MATPVTYDDLRVVGFDLGHADTALAAVFDTRKDDVAKLELPSAQDRVYVVVTAVAVRSDGGVVLGRFAIDQEDATELHLAFKNPQFDPNETVRPTVLFARGVAEELKQCGRLPDGPPTRWVFGTPSGWSPAQRATYHKILQSAGLDDVEVVPESRAALLFARDSGEVRSAGLELRGRVRRSSTVLVADLGSSTLDITVVTGDGAAPVLDTGSALGASLIDRSIMRWFLAASPSREAVERWIELDGKERRRFEFACRRAKEDFFTNDHPDAAVVRGQATYEPLDGGEDDYFPIRITRSVMDRILAEPQPALGGASWVEMLRKDLEDAAQKVDGRPDLVVLTGGASRMPFAMAIARQTYGDCVVMGYEPELAIARGLAIAGRVGVRSRNFRADISRLLDGDSIETVVANQLPSLADRLGAEIASGAFDRHVLPAFEEWRSGRYRTLQELESVVAASVAAELEGDASGYQRIVLEWQDGLRPDLNDLTRPICERWRIPSSSLDLPPLSVSARTWSGQLGLSAVLADQASDVALGIGAALVAAVIVALIAFGVALGPAGWAMLGVGALYALGAGIEPVEKAVKTRDLPVTIRRQFTATKLRATAAEKEHKLATDIADSISSSSGPQLVEQMTAILRAELEDVAREAELKHLQ